MSFEVSVEPGPHELTLDNNRAAFVINGVRDRLKRAAGLAASPMPGERAWRNMLKSDPSVDLVHFTILRPPEKQDGTPIRELSLIAFPIRELFDAKLEEFDLIIFDRYRPRSVMPLAYLDNIVSYVRKGGALLEAPGPASARPMSLYRSPLGAILPAEPTGEVSGARLRARADRARPAPSRHRRSAGQPAEPGEPPTWGRWFRQVDAHAASAARR